MGLRRKQTNGGLTERLTVCVKPETAERVGDLAHSKRVSISLLIAELIDDMLEQHDT